MVRLALTILLLTVTSPSLLRAQQNPPQITTVPVAGPIFMLQGGGGNIGVITDPAGLFIIDSMDERSADPVRAALKALPGGQRIRILIDTHWHSDHTDGNKVFGPEAVIVSQQNVRSLLAKSQNMGGQQTKPLPSGALPIVTFSDKLMLYAGDETVRLVHYANAHTDGDTVVFLDRSKVVHMGDMFFNGLFPYLDVANGGDIDNWVRQLDAILSELPEGVKIIPGHGPVAGISDLKAFRQMLYDSAETVRKQMKEGKTLEQIKAAGLPERFAPWTGGFLTTPQWLELVHHSLEK
jgi:glyoxylase-like metal-dependent hydrolase (beta-lactamase superfamily II)